MTPLVMTRDIIKFVRKEQLISHITDARNTLIDILKLTVLFFWSRIIDYTINGQACLLVINCSMNCFPYRRQAVGRFYFLQID